MGGGGVLLSKHEKGTSSNFQNYSISLYDSVNVGRLLVQCSYGWEGACMTSISISSFSRHSPYFFVTIIKGKTPEKMLKSCENTKLQASLLPLLAYINLPQSHWQDRLVIEPIITLHYPNGQEEIDSESLWNRLVVRLALLVIPSAVPGADDRTGDGSKPVIETSWPKRTFYMWLVTCRCKLNNKICKWTACSWLASIVKCISRSMTPIIFLSKWP